MLFGLGISRYMVELRCIIMCFRLISGISVLLVESTINFMGYGVLNMIIAVVDALNYFGWRVCVCMFAVYTYEVCKKRCTQLNMYKNMYSSRYRCCLFCNFENMCTISFTDSELNILPIVKSKCRKSSHFQSLASLATGIYNSIVEYLTSILN